jgi:hypothetical protein
LTTAEFIKAVLQERAWEFAGEWTRWFDLIRTETVAQALADRDSKENQLIGKPDDKSNWEFPILANDASKNPNL